jgi:hypothetical protein
MEVGEFAECRLTIAALTVGSPRGVGRLGSPRALVLID